MSRCVLLRLYVQHCMHHTPSAYRKQRRLGNSDYLYAQQQAHVHIAASVQPMQL